MHVNPKFDYPSFAPDHVLAIISFPLEQSVRNKEIWIFTCGDVGATYVNDTVLGPHLFHWVVYRQKNQ